MREKISAEIARMAAGREEMLATIRKIRGDRYGDVVLAISKMFDLMRISRVVMSHASTTLPPKIVADYARFEPMVTQAMAVILEALTETLGVTQDELAADLHGIIKNSRMR